MTKIKDVVTMKVPFPNIKSNLASKSHMYICIKDGNDKQFLSCQTKKPSNVLEDNPPYVYIEESSDINRNPFKWPTLIGCDYAFGIKNVRINSSLLAKRRRDICRDLYDDIKGTIKHSSFYIEKIDEDRLLKVNSLITKNQTNKAI